MQINTTKPAFSFPAFFNDKRYSEQAVGKICDALMDLSNPSAHPNAPLFSAKFKHIESEGATPIHLEVAIFAKETADGKPYLSCSIKPAQQRQESGNSPVPSASTKTPDFDDDIPF